MAIGNNALRESLVPRLLGLRFELSTVIHPKVIGSPSAVIWHGCGIMGTEAQLGLGVIANGGSVMDHHAPVHDFGHLGVNACMAGCAILGRKAWMLACCIRWQ
ncbi:MAG: hypothetical protein ACOYB1_10600 [Limnohabitans sp.]